MKKKLFILGAGIYQVPLIKKAKDMGLYTIAASCPGPYPGLAIADQALLIDTRDGEALQKAAVRESIDGICTSGTDVAVRSLGLLCDSLGLAGLPLTAARILTDKYRMKEAFCKGGVSTPVSIQVFSFQEALKAFGRLTPPVIVKAVDSSGSRGVTRADSSEELAAAYERACLATRKDYVLVEQFVTAHEIGVDGFISGGEVTLLLPHDKFVYTTKEGTSLPEGHHFPFHCSQETEGEIRRQICLAVRAVGMNQCAFNTDVLITDQGEVFILEIGGRAGATCIPELITLYSGVDYYEQIIRNALGEVPDFSSQTRRPAMAKLLFSPLPGILTQADYAFFEGLQEKGIFVSLDYSPGSSLPGVHDGTDRIGQVIMQTDCPATLDQVLAQVRSHIKIDGISLESLWNE